MKKTYTVLFIFYLAVFGCKNKVQQQAPTPIQKEKASDAELTDLFRYYHGDPQTQEQKDENAIIDYLASKGIDAIRTERGVYIHIAEIGDGPLLKWNQLVEVHYRGYFMDGYEFDSSYKRNKPIRFKIGTMVPGWNDALPYLKKGSKASLYLPSQMGYGREGFPDYVDPNTIIFFDVEILNNSQTEEISEQ